MDKLHFEYKCTFKKDKGKFLLDENGWPIPVEKKLTERGKVTITEAQAAHYNRRTSTATGLFYELAEAKPKTEKPLSQMSKVELGEYCKAKGYEDIDLSLSKAGIIAQISDIENPE